MIENTVIENYRNSLYVRYDDKGTAHYYTRSDFPGLVQDKFCFFNGLGNKLTGYFYYYDSYIPDKIIVFDHGMGAGHTAYMKEIEMLARKGYMVYSYDHNGCMESEGDGENGFAQSLHDLDKCISALKDNPKVKGKTFYAMGHSWGGYAVNNITSYHPDIQKIVVLSGPVSVRQLLAQNYQGDLSVFTDRLYETERKSNPGYAHSDAVTAIRASKVQALLIYSDNDLLATKEWQYDVLYDALKNEENVNFLLVKGKHHNPNYTVDAVTYLAEYLAELKRQTSNGLLATPQQKEEFVNQFDWDRMTRQDDAIWKEIFDFLNK